jgi:DGQHR domain-containing protein
LPLDSKGRVGLLDISQGAMLYALDGQHRLMAVRGLLDLIRTGSLGRRKKDGSSASGGPITVDEIAEKYEISRSYIQSLAAERIGVEVIAAVVGGETRDEARRRVRSIFVHVNRMAAQLTQGQLDQLNEDDGFSIVSRTTATEHPFLAATQNRVEWSASSLSDRSAALTTLKTLHEMADGYLARRDEYKPWLPSEEGLIPLRPDEQQLEAGTAEFNRLWDLLQTLPSYKKLEQGADTASLRRFSHDDPPGEAHMLFRPVGQVALANAIGTLVLQQQDLEAIFKKLRKYDSDGGFRLDVVSSPWYMVLYDPNKKRMSVRGLRLAQRLLEYLLGGGLQGDQERDKLRSDLAAARTINLGDANDPRWKDHEGQAIDFEGNWVTPDKVELPPAVRA